MALSPLRSLLTFAALALLALPAPAELENGASDLVGTAWRGDATIRLGLRSRAGGGRERLPSAEVVISFPTATAVTVTSGTVGSVSGTWEPHRKSKRRLVGAPDAAAVAGEAEALATVLGALVQDQIGRSATVTIEPRDGKLKGRLNRAGTQLDATLRYRFRGRIHVRGRSVPFQLTEKSRVKAVPTIF